MDFLAPIPAIVAAAMAIPLLLLLYFLKLRRQSKTVPSTMFWETSVHDLQANAPFQRLRPSWLLLLQLLLLAALLVALARPILGSKQAVAERVAILLDISASMSAVVDEPETEAGVPRTRFDEARSTALEIIDRLDERGSQSQAMIIAVGARARTIHPFSSDRRSLSAAIEAIEPTDETGKLQPALQLVEAFLESSDATGSGDNSAAASGNSNLRTRVILISDGRFADDASLEFAGRDRFEYIRTPTPAIGQRSPDSAVAAPDSETQNYGIVNFTARRDYGDPTLVRLLVTVLNATSESRPIPVRVTLDNEPIDMQAAEVPGARAAGPDQARLPGEVNLLFEFHNTEGGYVRASIVTDDILPNDNVAGMVLKQPERSGVLLVHPDNQQPDAYLTSVLDLLELRRLDHMSASAFAMLGQEGTQQQLERLARYELILFDRISPTFVPAVSTLSFGAAPPIKDVELYDVEDERPPRRVLSWDRSHPIMSDVNLDAVAIADRQRVRLPEDARVLAIGAGGPLIGLIENDGIRHVIVSFDLFESNWPIQPSFVIFIKNAVDFLTGRGQIEAGRAFRAGEPINIRPNETASQIHITGPDLDRVILKSEWRMTPRGEVILPPIERAGLYEAEGASTPDNQLVVNVASPTESDVKPKDELTISANPMPGRRIAESVPREVWKWFVGGALLLLLFEWWMYTSRARR